MVVTGTLWFTTKPFASEADGDDVTRGFLRASEGH